MVVGSEGGFTILPLVSRSCYWYHDLATVHGASGREFEGLGLGFRVRV